jgi:hypothetical protein
MYSFLIAILAAAGYSWETPTASYTPATSYSASYGSYSTSIPINDPVMRTDFDNSKCGSNCWGTSGYNHNQRAWDRAQEVMEAQREAFWAE